MRDVMIGAFVAVAGQPRREKAVEPLRQALGVVAARRVGEQRLDVVEVRGQALGQLRRVERQLALDRVLVERARAGRRAGREPGLAELIGVGGAAGEDVGDAGPQVREQALESGVAAQHALGAVGVRGRVDDRLLVELPAG